VQVAGRARKAAGDIVQLFGRVLDPVGKPLSGVKIEIWQCDAKGIYHHPGDWRGSADPNFQGYGTAIAVADGGYRFRTIKPVPYSGRTPHIHAMVSGAGMRRFTTQIYLKGHPQNADDFLFKGLGNARLQDASSVDFTRQRNGEAAGRFDIVIG
jgi:protocatechuate 3,4-dioxygenase, beta subunit